jgi:hypothetical protein
MESQKVGSKNRKATGSQKRCMVTLEILKVAQQKRSGSRTPKSGNDNSQRGMLAKQTAVTKIRFRKAVGVNSESKFPIEY